MIRQLVVSVWLSMMLTVCPVGAAEAPAPDPSRGDSYDGRAHPPGIREDLLLVPRMVLAPLRLAFQGIVWPVRRVVAWDERNQVVAHILAAFSTRDGMIGVRPAFQYSISFTPIVGLRVFDRKLLGPSTNAELTLMTGGADTFLGSAYVRPTPADRAYESTVQIDYVRRNDQVFTGIGLIDDTRGLRQPTRYAIELVDAKGGVHIIAAPGLFFDVSTGVGLRRYNNGVRAGDEPPIATIYCRRDLSGRCIPGAVDDVQVPGFKYGTQFFRVGASMRLDTRDNYYRPSSGALVELGADWTHGVGHHDDSHYIRAYGALSAVLDIWKRSRTLVLRFEVHALEPLRADPTPFSELIVLGGPDTFRGFRYGRFRNYSSLFAAMEYRWPVWMWMDAVTFVEYGGVFGRRFEGFSFDRMRPDVGVGVRLRSSDAFFVRAHVAYGWGDGGDGWQASVSVNTGL
jgi:hypothetical protein